MLRFLIRLIIYTIAMGFSIYIGVQWKLRDDLKVVVSRVFGQQVEFDYQNVYLTLSGKVVITDARLFFIDSDINLTANEISYSMGTVFEMAFQNQIIERGELPRSVEIEVDELMLHLNPALVKTISRYQTQSVWQQLSASGCGDLQSFGMNQYFSMGYDYLVVNGHLSLFRDPYNDHLQVEALAEIEETSRIVLQLDLADYFDQPWMINPDLSNIKLLILSLTDKGFNRRKIDYCANQSKISATSFLQQHVEKLTEKLAVADLALTPEALKAYTKGMQVASNIILVLEPEQSFSNKDIFYFGEAELRRLSGFKLEVNHGPVNKLFNNWSYEKYKRIKIMRKPKKIRANAGPIKRFETLLIKRSYHQEKLNNAEKFMDYRVKLVRDDHKIYLGRLKRINDKRLYIVKPIQGGEIEVSVRRDRVVDFYIYR